jgi:hypothetical protein
MSGLSYEQQKRAIEQGWSVWPEGVPITDVTKLPDRVQIAGDNPQAQQQALTQLTAEKAHLDEQIARLQTSLRPNATPTPESIFADLAQREQGASTDGADNVGAGLGMSPNSLAGETGDIPYEGADETPPEKPVEISSRKKP